MASAGLVRRIPRETGIVFMANDEAGSFVSNLRSEYLEGVKKRADWAVETFDGLSTSELDRVIKGLFEAWTIEFQPVESAHQGELQL